MNLSLEKFRHLYDFEPRYARLGRFNCHYLDEGSGDPLLMLHGNPSWSFMYRDLVKLLRRWNRVVVPDYIGCGLSDKPAESEYQYTLERRVDDLSELLEKLQLTRDLTLVLHDWGGLIGMCYASRNPEAIKRLVIFNTAAFRLPKGKHLPWILKFCRDTKLGAYLVLKFNAFAVGASHLGFAGGRDAKLVRKAYSAPYDSWSNRIATLRFVQDIPLVREDPAYPLVEQTEASLDQFANLPVLICWGMKDFVFDEDFLMEWVKRFPRAEVCHLYDAGHYVIEDEFGSIAPRIVDFLKRNPID